MQLLGTLFMINFDEYLDVVLSITDKIKDFDEWSDEKKLDFYTGLAKILRPPSIDLKDIFQITPLSSGACVEYPLDILIKDK